MICSRLSPVSQTVSAVMRPVMCSGLDFRDQALSRSFGFAIILR